jgi:hypothetical protein
MYACHVSAEQTMNEHSGFNSLHVYAHVHVRAYVHARYKIQRTIVCIKALLLDHKGTTGTQLTECSSSTVSPPGTGAASCS